MNRSRLERASLTSAGPMSKRLPLAAIILALVAAGAVPGSAMAYRPGPAAGHFMGGLTRQGWPVILVISKSARTASLVETGLDLTCSAGDHFSTSDGFVRLPIRADGTIHTSRAIPPSGALLGGRHTLSAKLNRRLARFAGTWELQVNFSTAGGQVDSCDSGTVPLRA